MDLDHNIQRKGVCNQWLQGSTWEVEGMLFPLLLPVVEVLSGANEPPMAMLHQWQ